MRTFARISRYAIIGFALMSVCLSVSQTVCAKTILRMNHQFPADAAGSKIDQWFADEVRKATNGDVDIKIFWENSLGTPQETLSLIKDGAIDMAAMSAGYFPAELPFFSAPNSIPMGLDTICQSSELMKAVVDSVPAFMEEAAQQRIRPLFFHLLNPYLLVTKEPVRSLDDINGKRIRVWGNDMPELIKAAGGKPIPLFLPELYDAMKQGVLDGCPFSVDLVVTYKLYELAQHITEVVLWEGPSWGIWISDTAWQSLSPEYQHMMREIAEQARQRELEATQQAEKEARTFLVAQGVQFHPFSAEELAKWQAATPDFFANWIQKMAAQEKGDAAKHTVELWKTIRRQTTCP